MDRTARCLCTLVAAAVVAACTPNPGGPDARPGGSRIDPVKPAEDPGPPVTAAAPVPWPEVAPAGKQDERGAPLSLTASDGTGLRLVSLTSRGVVDAPLAFTELHLVFENPEDRTIEGRFEIEMPPGAAISRFAMKIGGRWQEGEVVERQAARVAYEDFLHRRQDPALLENNAGNSFSARVFPIAGREKKELIISYSQELVGSDEPYRVMLRGLPELEALEASVVVREPKIAPPMDPLAEPGVQARVFAVSKSKWRPDRDLEVKVFRPGAVGLRHGRLAVARVAPGGETAAAAKVGSLVVLFDTSASRSLGFARQFARLKDVLKDLRDKTGEDFALRIVAFDQRTAEVYAGRASGLGDGALERLRSRRALGASDLAGALAAVADAPGKATRLLVVSDGIATAGDNEAAGLRAAGEKLARAGIERADAIVVGGIRDVSMLKAITTADLPRDGVVIDGELAPAAIADKLRAPTLPPLNVEVAGAAWTWPAVVEGAQPGDELLVYADLPEGSAMTVKLTETDEGAKTSAVTVEATPTERPLLERAWIRAQIERLQAGRSALASEDAKGRAELKRSIVELSTRYRVLSDFTALLVLETEEDYRRFGIDRAALADILTVGAVGVTLQQREPPPEPKPAPETKRWAESKTAEMKAEMKRAARETKLDEAPPVDAENSEEEAGGVAFRPPADPGAVLEAPADAMFELAAGDVDEAPKPLEEESKVGGLGLVGTGRGGGGTGEGTIRLGGQLGGQLGPQARLGGRGDAGPTVRQGEATVTGKLSREIVRRVVRAHLGEVRNCYADSLADDRTLAGRVTIKLVIDADGEVRSAEVQEDTLTSPRVGTCVTVWAEDWEFPRPSDGAGVTAVFPFVFEPGDGSVTFAPQEPAQPQIEEEPSRPKIEPYTGKFLAIHQRLRAGDRKGALVDALAWHDEEPGDVLALVAVGEAAAAGGDRELAARAFGSLIDLFPARADLRRYAGARLEQLGDVGLALAVDTYAKAAESRPDHPASHRMLAFALVKVGRHREAFEALVRGLEQDYPDGRFAAARRILSEDLGLVAAAWRRAEPKAAVDIDARLGERLIALPTEPSTRFVITWETDANDVDFHVRDGKRGHAYYQSRALPSGGELYADVVTGYGPECFTITGRPTAFPYTLEAHYYSRGPMGYGMGKLQIVQHDGKGGLRFEERPFVIMQDDAFVDLGRLTAPL